MFADTVYKHIFGKEIFLNGILKRRTLSLNINLASAFTLTLPVTSNSATLTQTLKNGKWKTCLGCFVLSLFLWTHAARCGLAPPGINKCDVAAVGGAYGEAPWLRLHPRWVWQLLSTPSSVSFTLISGPLRRHLASTVRKASLNGRMIGVSVPRRRESPGAVLECLAFVLDWRLIECAGRCCAPEPECGVRAGCQLGSAVRLFMVQP